MRIISDVTLISALTIHPLRRRLIKRHGKNRRGQRRWDDGVTKPLLRAFHEQLSTGLDSLPLKLCHHNRTFSQPSVHLFYSSYLPFINPHCLFMLSICLSGIFTPSSYVFIYSRDGFKRVRPCTQRESRLLDSTVSLPEEKGTSFYSTYLLQSHSQLSLHILLSSVFEKCHVFREGQLICAAANKCFINKHWHFHLLYISASFAASYGADSLHLLYMLHFNGKFLC